MDEILVDNPTEFDITIDVADRTGSAWLGVGTASHRSKTAFDEIIDQGQAWTFRFSSQGHPVGEVRASRAELESGDWTITIPGTVGVALRDQGEPPSP